MDWERLISDYFDDVLTPEETAELFDWIHQHPDNARLFSKAAFMHRHLQHRLSAMRLLQSDAGLAMPASQAPSPSDATHLSPAPFTDRQRATDTAPQPPRSKFSAASWRLWGLAASILLMAGVLAYLAWPHNSPARLLAAEYASWKVETPVPQQGQRLPFGTLTLDSGLIKLGFENGNQILIQAPARFAVIDENALTLEAGSLTATVTQSGRGLQISTSTARVTDLGTEFGVHASAASTKVMVFSGKVSVEARSGQSRAQELLAGSAVDVSPAGISRIALEPAVFKRTMTAEIPPLDLVDLIAGGDGTGSASGVGIDAANGRTRQTHAVTIRRGGQRYLPINDHRVLDGCFIPGGRMTVDSAGHLFSFPTTSLFSYGLIWAGPDIPWEGELPIATTMPQDLGSPTSRVLVIHSNNGFTLNLDAVRALHPQARITGFRAAVGNSYRPPAPDSSPSRPLASIHLIVDGTARFERRVFSNREPLIDVRCNLTDSDRFLTIATTDGGDGNACDWVLWTRPELSMQPRYAAAAVGR